jgi:hypothetical protein
VALAPVVAAPQSNQASSQAIRDVSEAYAASLCHVSIACQTQQEAVKRGTKEGMNDGDRLSNTKRSC